MSKASETIRLQELGKIKAKYTTDEGTSDVEDYDPHEHRQLPHPTTNMETLIHMLKGSLGTGILAMPEAFKNAGIINGFIFTILIGALCTYGLHILVRLSFNISFLAISDIVTYYFYYPNGFPCSPTNLNPEHNSFSIFEPPTLVQAQYVLCKRMKVPLLTYPDSMKAALLSGPRMFHCFANASPILVDVFLVIYQLGICCVYVMFVAVNLQVLVNVYLTNKLGIEIYTLMLLIPFILIISIPNLKWLAPFSLFSNVVTFACFGIVLYYIFKDLPSLGDRPYVGTFYTFPLFFGTTLFALEAVGVVIALENNMKTPKSFGGYFGVLNVAMFFITLSYVGMGFLGYWRYGEGTLSSITLNFPKSDVLSKVVQGLYSLAIYISYGLQGFVPIDILWNTYLAHLAKRHTSNPNYLKAWEYLLRIITVLVTFVLAVSIPMLGLFISLFGAFCLSALGIAFPAIMEICIKWPDELGRGQWILIKNIFLILIGICGLLAGTYSCISEIIYNIREGKQ